MADKVGVKENEYTELAAQIQEVHTASLESIQTALDKIETLNGTGGGFYVKELTPKIDALIQEINSVSSLMESAFTAHEEIINSFQRAIENYDICR